MILDVAVPYRVRGSFHYEIEDSLGETLAPGSVVKVPFRNRSIHGFVLGFPGSSDIEISRLKRVEEVLVPEPLFNPKMLEFLKWISDYYCHPLGEVLAAAIPKQRLQKNKKERASSRPIKDPTLGLAVPQKEITLTAEQKKAIETILRPEDQKPVLLHGVTGSGKTEVYMAIIEAALAEGKGAIVLVPEIALTPQLLGRFSGRFPGRVAVLHSDLSPSVRTHQWKALKEGTHQIVIGARSAIFAPLNSVGVIIVDEEHEASFKQEDSLRYHGRDLAIVRGQMEGAKVVLGSATPSLESYENARRGKYTYVALTQRVNARPLPHTTLINLNSADQACFPEAPWLSRTLYEKIKATLERKEQTLLFLNRLGFAHFLYCRDCGHSWRCHNCSVALTYYRHPPQLKCHYCGSVTPAPTVCEKCSGRNLETMGSGTEQVEQMLQKIFPNARVTRFDRSRIKNRKDLEETLTSIAERQVDIVVGTQMIAKGHDFPFISLVGILFADAHLSIPDFRAFERTYQILMQVAGRAGRAEIAGEVLIQTVNPEHPVLLMAAAQQTEQFYSKELESRRAFGFPPFYRLALLRFQHTNPKTVEDFAWGLCARMRSYFATSIAAHDIDLLGPASAPLAKVKGMYRWHCLVKSTSVKNLRLALQFAQHLCDKHPSSVTMAADVDPVNSL